MMIEIIRRKEKNGSLLTTLRVIKAGKHRFAAFCNIVQIGDDAYLSRRGWAILPGIGMLVEPLWWIGGRNSYGRTFGSSSRVQK